MGNAIIQPNPTFIQDFQKCIRSMPKYVCFLISSCKSNPLSESLLYYIQNKNLLHISNNGSRTNKKSRGSWIISLQDSTVIISGWNPDFGRILDNNCYHSEIYASLVSLIFLECYWEYYSLPLSNPIEVFYDNKLYGTNINELNSNEYSKLFMYNIKEREAYIDFFNIIPKHFTVSHVEDHRGHLKIMKTQVKQHIILLFIFFLFHLQFIRKPTTSILISRKEIAKVASNAVLGNVYNQNTT